MSRATKNSTHVMDTSVNQEISMISQDSSSSDQEIEVQIPQCFPPPTCPPQSFVQPMFMPYIKGPKMDWTVNDSFPLSTCPPQSLCDPCLCLISKGPRWVGL